MDIGQIIAVSVFGVLALIFIVLWIIDKHNEHKGQWFTYEGHKFHPKVIDKDTKLPKLPEGWFWVVLPDEEDDPQDESKWRRIVVWLRRADGTTVGGFAGNVIHGPKDAIKRNANSILHDMRKSVDKEDWLAPYFGHYPPKSL